MRNRFLRCFGFEQKEEIRDGVVLKKTAQNSLVKALSFSLAQTCNSPRLLLSTTALDSLTISTPTESPAILPSSSLASVIMCWMGSWLFNHRCVCEDSYNSLQFTLKYIDMMQLNCMGIT